MDIINKTLITAAILSLTATSVSAEWYIGADAIQNQLIPYPSSLSSQQIDNYRSIEIEDRFSLFGGYRSNENFSLQLEYQDEISFGIDDMFAGSSLWFPESNTHNFESTGLYLSGISNYTINENSNIYMKGGLFNWEIDSNSFATNPNYFGNSSGTDLFYGLGANYDLNARFAVSAEWERYQMEKSDFDYLSTKLQFKF
jgi:hypothetical protein